MKNFTLIKSSILFLTLVLSVSLLQAQDESKKEPTTAEIAKELANPNTTLGTMAFQFDYMNYQGDLPDANSQNSLTLNFQPSLPIPLGKGVNLFVRPNIPIYFSQPIYGLSLSFIKLDNKSERTKERNKVSLYGEAKTSTTLITLSLLLLRFRSVL